MTSLTTSFCPLPIPNARPAEEALACSTAILRALPGPDGGTGEEAPEAISACTPATTTTRRAPETKAVLRRVGKGLKGHAPSPPAEKIWVMEIRQTTVRAHFGPSPLQPGISSGTFLASELLSGKRAAQGWFSG